MPDPPLDLSGKLLLIYPSRAVPSEAAGILVEFPTLEERSGQAFLSGRRPATRAGQWVTEQHVSIAWSAVVSYYIFESREDYMNRVAIFRRVRAQARR